MTDTSATVASLATAGGTLVLAIATFGAVRSANRAARATERALHGIAVLDRWDFRVYREGEERAHRDPTTFRRLTRDIFVAPGDIGVWQGAFRDPEEPVFSEARTAIEQRQRLMIDVLYTDHEGGQRTITRWGLTPHESGAWLPTVTAHWNLDRDDPR